MVCLYIGSTELKEPIKYNGNLFNDLKYKESFLKGEKQLVYTFLIFLALGKEVIFMLDEVLSKEIATKREHRIKQLEEEERQSK